MAALINRRVLLQNLAAKPELNGCYGTTTAFVEEKQRLAVALDRGGSGVLLKEQNLEIMPYEEMMENTPPFVHALSDAHPSPVDKGDAIKMALDAGHLLNTRPAPSLAVIEVCVRIFQSWQAPNPGGFPNPLYVKVALEAGLKTFSAMTQLFTRVSATTGSTVPVSVFRSRSNLGCRRMAG